MKLDRKYFQNIMNQNAKHNKVCKSQRNDLKLASFCYDAEKIMLIGVYFFSTHWFSNNRLIFYMTHKLLKFSAKIVDFWWKKFKTWNETLHSGTKYNIRPFGKYRDCWIVFFYILWKKSRLKSTFLPYHVKKHHSTLEMDTFKIMLLLYYLA